MIFEKLCKKEKGKGKRKKEKKKDHLCHDTRVIISNIF